MHCIVISLVPPRPLPLPRIRTSILSDGTTSPSLQRDERGEGASHNHTPPWGNSDQPPVALPISFLPGSTPTRPHSPYPRAIHSVPSGLGHLHPGSCSFWEVVTPVVRRGGGGVSRLSGGLADRSCHALFPVNGPLGSCQRMGGMLSGVRSAQSYEVTASRRGGDRGGGEYPQPHPSRSCFLSFWFDRDPLPHPLLVVLHSFSGLP